MKPFLSSAEVDKSAADEVIDFILCSKRVIIDNVEVCKHHCVR